MYPLFFLIDLAGAAALLLWGAHMVQTGVQRAFGPRLRVFLSSALRNRVRAFLAGVIVTAALQSSTATGLMVARFAARGTLALTTGLAVMLGANVGTTLIVQVVSFNVVAVSPVLILAGFLLFRRGTGIGHDLGRVFIGLGLMLLSLRLLLETLVPLEHSLPLQALLASTQSATILYLFVGAVMAWAAHSSVATVLFVMALAGQGTIAIEPAFALVLGANLGTAVNPLLEGARADDPLSQRLPVGNLLTRIIGVGTGLLCLPQVSGWLSQSGADPVRAVANFHTLFNVAVAVLWMPFLTPYATLLRRLLPDRPETTSEASPRYLDPAARSMPALALGAASREALRLADFVERMLEGTRDALGGDRRKIEPTKQLDDVVDRLNASIKSYLTSIRSDTLSDDNRRRLDEILVFITNMEHAGDTIDRSLLPLAGKRIRRGLAFSPAGQREIDQMLQRLLANVRMAASLFMHEDARAAHVLAQEKETFRQLESGATQAHFDRLREGRMDSAETSALHLDLLRDMKLINSHVVAAAAYPVLERSGELLPSRIAR